MPFFRGQSKFFNGMGAQGRKQPLILLVCGDPQEVRDFLGRGTSGTGAVILRLFGSNFEGACGQELKKGQWHDFGSLLSLWEQKGRRESFAVPPGVFQGPLPAIAC